MAWSLRLDPGVKWFLTVFCCCWWCKIEIMYSYWWHTLCICPVRLRDVKKKKNRRCSVYLKLGMSNPCSQFCFWTSWREYDSLCYPAISSQLLVLQRGKEILPQCSYCFWMGICIFRLLVVFMLNFIQDHKCTAPKDFMFGSDVFIYVSLTILTVGLNRKSAESLCYAGPTCFLSLMDWAGHLVSVGLVFCTFYL